MKNKSCCNRERPVPATDADAVNVNDTVNAWRGLLLGAVFVLLCVLVYAPPAVAGGDAPSWMHALVSAPLPAYDEKADAVLLYSETNVTVLSTDKIRTQVRVAYKILRPNGRSRGIVEVDFGPQKKVKSLHGWCIPAQGKDYEVKGKDATEVSPAIEGGEISDTKLKVL